MRRRDAMLAVKALAQRVQRARADVAVDDADGAKREQPRPEECSGWTPFRAWFAEREAEGANRGDDVEELPESRRQTPVKDGIQTASKSLRG